MRFFIASKTLVLSVVVSLILASCSYFPQLSDEERNSVLSDPFKERLRQGYLFHADWEKEQGDNDDAGHYRYKVKSLVNGLSIDPEGLSARKIPTDNLNELADARNKLATAFAKNAKTIVPVLAADAQVAFDCWVEQQEENFQPEHIAACRKDFMLAAEAMADALKPKEIPVPELVMPDPYIVFFDFDKDKIRDSARQVLDGVAEAIVEFTPSRVIIEGHADTVGTNDYNKKLSERRAKAVAKVLTEKGVYEGLLEVKALGEDAPMVPTKDGVKEEKNRYGRIILVK